MAVIEPSSDRVQSSSLSISPDAHSAAQQDLWIFRTGKTVVSGPAMLRRLSVLVHETQNESALIDALILAGQLEAAIADAGKTTDPAATLTDAIADALLSRKSESALLQRFIEALQAPESLTVAPPEGFTYYCLHPLDFATVFPRSDLQRPYAAIGVRSIGTTLSAIVLAALRSGGNTASRITVRPTGHPYSRTTQFTSDQLQWVRANLDRSAHFLVVDEGPGRSGSTFLSVAEALLSAGVSTDRITVIGSRQPDINSLCAENAASRWRSFNFICAQSSLITRFRDCQYIGSGEWRRFFFASQDLWPATWAQMERFKMISRDGQSMHKFEGMGSIGSEVRDRAFHLAESGFGPPVLDAANGFLQYKLVEGTRPIPQDVTPLLLDKIAEYCAFRAANFSASNSASQELGDMLRFNILQEFGVEVDFPAERLVSAKPVITDGAMHCHEWMVTPCSELIKADGVDHGDNHFFPGPCDIAWDIAGCGIEWQLSPAALEYLRQRFQWLSGVEVSANLTYYMLAYCVFRMGFCKMAVSTSRGMPEEHRLLRAYKGYRARALKLLGDLSSGATSEFPSSSASSFAKQELSL